MAQVLIRYCDQHQAVDENIEGEQWKLTLQPPGEREVGFDVDLCPVCSKPLRDLIEHFDDIARKLKRPSGGASGKAQAADTAAAGDPEDSIPCPECVDYAAPNRSALGAHARARHHKTLSQLLGETPLFQCLVCEGKPTYSKGQGFAAHRRAAHKLSPNNPLIPGEVLADPEATSIPAPPKHR